jgi:peptidoglycan/xylan/chitin deacetylase (PgdA/CDA1 family)
MTGVPILTFHAVDEQPSNLSYPPRQFEYLLKKLIASGWHCLPLDEIVTCLRLARPLPRRAFAITFDDGYQSIYTAALPVLGALGLTATVFAISGKGGSAQERLPSINERIMLSWAELKQLQLAGIGMGAHTQTHAELPALSEPDIASELKGSKDILENILGSAVTSFAYPKGLYDARCRNIAAQYFACACSDQFAYAQSGSDRFTLERIDSYYLRSNTGIALTLGRMAGLYVPLRRVMRAVRRAVIGLPE